MQAMAEVMAKSKAFKAAKQAQQDEDQGRWSAWMLPTLRSCR